MRRNKQNSLNNGQNYENCNICPRNCGVNRANGQLGYCGCDDKIRLARAALHFWEEPCISGKNGSGAVFFSGCSLRCVFCQNYDIARAKVGKEISPAKFVDILLDLQEQGANNINLVTPTHYINSIIKGIEKAKEQGLNIPIVYNTSSYEKVDTLKRLEGIVDIYLPDFKYFNNDLAFKYSRAKDYKEVSEAAIEEMHRQQPQNIFKKENDITGKIITEAEDGYIMQKGVIVRHLMLPDQMEDSKNVIKYLHETYGNSIYISMMSQYTPLKHVEEYPELNRKVSRTKYDQLVDYAIDLGVENGFIQEEDVAEESFIPEFDYTGLD